MKAIILAPNKNFIIIRVKSELSFLVEHSRAGMDGCSNQTFISNLQKYGCCAPYWKKDCVVPERFGEN